MEYRVELSIKNMEKWEKIHILGIFGGHVPVHLECVPVKVYRYTLPEPNVYRYTLGVYQYTLFCFPNFDQFSYFGHNLLISYPI